MMLYSWLRWPQQVCPPGKLVKQGPVPVLSALQISMVYAGMIFIPCFKGYSHRPDEFSSAEQMAAGVRVLAMTLAELSLRSDTHLEL